MAALLIGRVSNWIADKGYGFIERDDDGTAVFVHVNDVRRAGLARLRPGRQYSFRLGKFRDRLTAIDLQPFPAEAGGSP